MSKIYGTVLSAIEDIKAQMRLNDYMFKATFEVANMEECVGQFGPAGRIEISLGSVELTGFDPVTHRWVREDTFNWIIPAMMKLAEEAHDPHEPCCPHYHTWGHVQQLKEKLEKEWGMKQPLLLKA